MTALRPHQSQPTEPPRVSGIPASVPTSLANLMSLTPVPGQAAPGFRLTDQTGHTLSLASFKGHAVVLEFMDPHCTDICPIVSQEFIDAYRDLGSEASQGGVRRGERQRLPPRGRRCRRVHPRAAADHASRPRHFLTGPVSSLQAVWRAYEVDVHAPSPNADIVPPRRSISSTRPARSGSPRARWSTTTSNGTAYLPLAQQASWGRGIALIARQLAR